MYRDNTLELVTQIDKLFSQGMSIPQIAVTLDYPEHRVRILRREFGLTRPQKALKNKFGSTDTLCVSCAHAGDRYGVCPWSREYKPVEGWSSIRRDIPIHTGLTESYFAIDCPKFVEG